MAKRMFINWGSFFGIVMSMGISFKLLIFPIEYFSKGWTLTSMMLSDRSPFPRSFYFKVSWMMALVKEKFFKLTIMSSMLALHSLCKFGEQKIRFLLTVWSMFPLIMFWSVPSCVCEHVCVFNWSTTSMISVAVFLFAHLLVYLFIFMFLRNLFEVWFCVHHTN